MKLKKILNEEFTQKDWDEHISHVADIIVDMAKSDADGDKGELLDNVKNYLQDATDDISGEIRKRLRGGKNVRRTIAGKS